MPERRTLNGEVSAMLDLVFDLPADVQPDIDETVSGVDAGAARRCLVARLASAYRRGDSAMFQALFDRLGVGDQGEALRAIVGDVSACRGARATAIEILASGDASLHGELLGSIHDAERAAIADEPLRELVADAIEDTVAAEAIAVVADHLPRKARASLADRLERLRKGMGAPATTVYEHLLRSKRLADHHAPMIEAIVEEAAPEGLRLLESLRGTIDGAALNAAIARIHERIAAGTSACREATGRLGPIDGTGRFETGVLCTSDDGSRTYAMLLIRAEEILDGFADFDPSDDFLRSGHVPRVEVSAEAVAHVVEPALRKADRAKLDSMTLAAVRLFERIGSPCALPAPEPAERVSAADIATLLSRSEYRRWAFTAAEFHAAGIAEPPADPDDDWIADAAARLDSPALRERLADVAATMARWHLAAGEPTEASLLARIARDVPDHFSEMFCVRELIRHSVARLHAPDPPDDGGSDITPDELTDPSWNPARAREEIVIGVVERQIEEGNPACVRETFEALRARGMTESDARRAIAGVLRNEICSMLGAGRPHDNGQYARALRALTVE